MKPITISAFKGMDNIAPGVSKNIATPERIVDALPGPDGELVVRPGYGKIISLADCSSLWKSPGTSRVFCLGNGSLCLANLSAETATPILDIPMPQESAYFANHGPIDFVGNKYWVTAVENATARKWGQSVEDLQAMNWQTTEDGLVLYLTDAAGEETVISHPGENVHAPNPLSLIVAGHGRIWGARGKQVLYSCAGLPEWWHDEVNHFDYATKPTMIYPVAGGVFVGTETETIFLSGSDPGQAQETTKQWLGVKKDSLVIAPKISEMPVDTPTWMNTEGIVVAGMPDGSIVELTKERVQVTPASKCAAGVIKINGIDTLLYRIEE